MRITKFLRFSNYIQLKNGRLIYRPMPPIATTNKDKQQDKQKEKEQQYKQQEKNKNKEGFPWE